MDKLLEGDEVRWTGVEFRKKGEVGREDGAGMG